VGSALKLDEIPHVSCHLLQEGVSQPKYPYAIAIAARVREHAESADFDFAVDWEVEGDTVVQGVLSHFI